jgi:hypothetical protein
MWNDGIMACRVTPAISAICCWEYPRACRASRNLAPLPAPCLSLKLPPRSTASLLSYSRPRLG